jgi:hypothetical protein
MLDKKKHAVAGIVLSGHEERVLIRPTRELLHASRRKMAAVREFRKTATGSDVAKAAKLEV